MATIRQLVDQLGSTAYRWLFAVNVLGLAFSLWVAHVNGSFLPLATVIATANIVIILVQASVAAFWKRTSPIHRRTDDPEV